MPYRAGAMPKLTKARLSKITPGEIVRDSELRGFFAQAGRTTPPRVTLRAQADLKGPPLSTRKITFGTWPDLDLETARAQAMVWLAGIKRNVDPSAPKEPTAQPGPLTVARMFAHAREHMVADGRAKRTIDDLAWLEKSYLAHWAERPAFEVKRSELRAEHERITRDHGPVAANKAVRAFRLAYNIALSRADEQMPGNPAQGVKLHRQRARDAVIEPEELSDWHARLQTVPNPARRLMHEIGLFCALRPGVLVSLERSWLDLDRQVIIVPRARMKVNRGRPDFALPLSKHVVGLCRAVLDLAELTHRGGRWLWPTQGKGGAWQATVVWRESKLPNETGHVLRATWRTQAKAAGVDDFLAACIMDHAAGDMRDVYIRSGIWTPLLEAQERVSARLLTLINPTLEPGL
jgi:integrase